MQRATRICKLYTHVGKHKPSLMWANLLRPALLAKGRECLLLSGGSWLLVAAPGCNVCGLVRALPVDGDRY